MNFDPAIIASALVGVVAAGSAYASQRAASRATTLNSIATSRVDMEKEAYERARKFDTETINRQDADLDELRAENEELQLKIRTLISHIIRIEQERIASPQIKEIDGKPEPR